MQPYVMSNGKSYINRKSINNKKNIHSLFSLRISSLGQLDILTLQRRDQIHPLPSLGPQSLDLLSQIIRLTLEGLDFRTVATLFLALVLLVLAGLDLAGGLELVTLDLRELFEELGFGREQRRCRLGKVAVVVGRAGFGAVAR